MKIEIRDLVTYAVLLIGAVGAFFTLENQISSINGRIEVLDVHMEDSLKLVDAKLAALDQRIDNSEAQFREIRAALLRIEEKLDGKQDR